MPAMELQVHTGQALILGNHIKLKEFVIDFGFENAVHLLGNVLYYKYPKMSFLWCLWLTEILRSFPEIFRMPQAESI